MPGDTKARMRLRTTKTETGSVLMETVIAVPLFMLLIGGIMWIGQLMYDKQKLVIADRYVAWNYGNRQTGAVWQDVQGQFFSQAVSEIATSQQPQVISQSPWWHLVRGEADSLVWMPSWTHGWLTADAIMKNQPFTMPIIVSLYGRDLGNGGVGGHYVVMRTVVNDTREKSVDPGPSEGCPPLTVNWANIAGEDRSPGSHAAP